MGWLWKWLFINRKAEMLQKEISELKAELSEQLKRRDDWRATSEAACRDRDLANSEYERTLSAERKHATDTISELQSRIQQLETSIAINQQKTLQLEQSQISLNDLVRFRDQQIEETQTTNSHELRARETKIQNLEQMLRNLNAEMTSKLEASTRQIAQMTSSNHRNADELMKATARIQELEQQLLASESHSDERAEQRSALLRNMAEINRLSSLITKSELASNSFKLIQPDSNGDEVTQFSTWNVYGDVESA